MLLASCNINIKPVIWLSVNSDNFVSQPTLLQKFANAGIGSATPTWVFGLNVNDMSPLVTEYTY